jgi:hypothetical protein
MASTSRAVSSGGRMAFVNSGGGQWWSTAAARNGGQRHGSLAAKGSVVKLMLRSEVKSEVMSGQSSSQGLGQLSTGQVRDMSGQRLGQGIYQVRCQVRSHVRPGRM